MSLQLLSTLLRRAVTRMNVECGIDCDFGSGFVRVGLDFMRACDRERSLEAVMNFWKNDKLSPFMALSDKRSTGIFHFLRVPLGLAI